ncbi:MAG: hypothetical protein R3B84_22250 [Zavarzinella sp.]
MNLRKIASENAPGPFYAEDIGTDCGCLLPEGEAPTLLATTGPPRYQTYFLRQPETPLEIEQACAAIRICHVHSLRYGGKDPEILTRLADVPHLCDYQLTRDGRVIPAGW